MTMCLGRLKVAAVAMTATHWQAAYRRDDFWRYWWIDCGRVRLCAIWGP